MQITKVDVRKIAENGKMKAVVSVVVDACFVIHDIKVIEHEGRMFVAMPSKWVSDKRYRDVAHPICPETRRMFQENIMQAYQRALIEKTQTKKQVE